MPPAHRELPALEHLVLAAVAAGDEPLERSRRGRSPRRPPAGSRAGAAPGRGSAPSARPRSRRRPRGARRPARAARRAPRSAGRRGAAAAPAGTRSGLRAPGRSAPAPERGRRAGRSPGRARRGRRPRRPAPGTWRTAPSRAAPRSGTAAARRTRRHAEATRAASRAPGAAARRLRWLCRGGLEHRAALRPARRRGPWPSDVLLRIGSRPMARQPARQGLRRDRDRRGSWSAQQPTLAPNLSGRLFGLDPEGNPQASYLGRLFGARDVVLGAGVLRAPKKQKQMWADRRSRLRLRRHRRRR